MSATHAETQTKRHPIRGALYGLLLGIGVAVYLVIFAVTPFAVSTTGIVVALCVVLGAAWGAFAPAKQPSSPAPSSRAFGTTFTHAAAKEDTASESYEGTFGATPPAAAPPEEAVFGEPPQDERPPA